MMSNRAAYTILLTGALFCIAAGYLAALIIT